MAPVRSQGNNSGGAAATSIAAGDDVTIVANAGTTGTTRRSSLRTRFRIDASVVAPDFSITPPLKRAEDHILSHTRTLLPGLAPLMEEKGKKFLSLAQTMFLKDRNVTRMGSDLDYIPISARSAFKLQAWKEAEATPEFTTLNSENVAMVKIMQLELKQQIIKNIKLEMSVLTKKILTDLCESLFIIVELFLEALGRNTELSHEMVLACLQLHSNVKLKHASMPSEEFTVLYRTVCHFPPDTAATATLVWEREVIKRALTQVFSASWDLYLKTQKDNELCLSLKKKAKEALQVQATEEAAMEVDTEVPESQQQLRDLVQREATKVADKRINALRQELATIKKLVLAKNRGGANHQRAPQQKEKKQDGKRPNNQRGTDGTVVPTHRSKDSDGGITTSGNNNSRRNPQCNTQARSHGGRAGGRP
jgi:hypothetical protein